MKELLCKILFTVAKSQKCAVCSATKKNSTNCKGEDSTMRDPFFDLMMAGLLATPP